MFTCICTCMHPCMHLSEIGKRIHINVSSEDPGWIVIIHRLFNDQAVRGPQFVWVLDAYAWMLCISILDGHKVPVLWSAINLLATCGLSVAFPLHSATRIHQVWSPKMIQVWYDITSSWGVFRSAHCAEDSDRFFVGLAGASMGTSAAVFSASAMVILRIQVNDDGCSKWLQWRRNIKQIYSWLYCCNKTQLSKDLLTKTYEQCSFTYFSHLESI